MIHDLLENSAIVKLVNDNFYRRNANLISYSINNFKVQAVENENSPYINNQLHLKSNIVWFRYRYNKYIYDEVSNLFHPVKFDLMGFTNKEIFSRFSDGIKSLRDLNFLMNKYDQNTFSFSERNFLTILIQQLIKPLYLYQIISISIWSISVTDEGPYYQMIIVVTILSLAILLCNSYYKYKRFECLLDNKGENKVTISRREFVKLSQECDIEQILPGDILMLEPNSKVPCDAVILEGICTVNEADLTGEGCHVMKLSLKSNNKMFNYKNNTKNILFQGTRLIKCNSMMNGEKIKVLSINTGFNTSRGNQLQNIFNPKNDFRHLQRSQGVLIIGLVFIFVISNILYLLIHYTGQPETKFETQDNNYFIKILYADRVLLGQPFKDLLDNLTIIIPPILPICLTFTSFYFNYKLQKKGVTCMDDQRMIAAGFVNVIVLDKTGTLTEENLYLQGFQFTTLMNNEQDKSEDSISYEPKKCEIQFQQVQTNAHVLNLVLKQFWRNYLNKGMQYLDEQPLHNDYRNNMIFFCECLACCLNIDQLGTEKFGNLMDKKIDEQMGWVQTYNPYTFKIEKYPAETWEISESLVLKFEKNYIDRSIRYKQVIIRKFKFSSKFQTMAVITQNSLDKSFRFYIKGAPETVLSYCKTGSLPQDINETLSSYTKKGLRVLACATKHLPEGNYESENVSRDKFEKELVFLGFIIFKNKLKKDTKNIIEHLNKSETKMIMSTGDNPFTSISVAQETRLLPLENISLYLIEGEETENYEMLRIYQYFTEIKSMVPQELFAGSQIKNFDDDNQELAKKSIEIFFPKFKNIRNDDFDSSTDRSTNLIKKRMSVKTNELFSAYHEYDDFIKVLQIIISNVTSQACFSGKLLKLVQHHRNSKLKSSKLRRDRDVCEPSSKENLCDSSKSVFLRTKDEIMELLLKSMKEKGKIFFRMDPNDKVDLINLIKEDPNTIVSMVGDGANDCGALITSDVGISISQKMTSHIASHFISENESIRCLEVILRYGRACHENNMIVYKYMIHYAIIQLTSKILLSFDNLSLTNIQYFFQDFFISMIMCLVISKTGAAHIISKESLRINFFHPKFIVSTVGQLVILISIQSAFYFFIYFQELKIGISEDKLKKQNEFIFLLSSLQCVIVLLVFNHSYKNRKSILFNKMFLLLSVLLLVILLLITLLESGFFINYTQFNVDYDSVDSHRYSNQINRCALLLFMSANVFLSFIFEQFVIKFFRTSSTQL